MLLAGSDIQNNPARDLVTPRNPQSYYSFINYLKCEGRLLDFLNLGISYPLRKDFAGYIKWVAQFFSDQVSYGTPAQSIAFDDASKIWIVTTPKGSIHAHALLLGTGRSRNIPDSFAALMGPRVFHLCDYLSHMDALGSDLQSVAVLGASQSAVEIHLDLLSRYPQLEIHAVHRSFAMRQKDTSPFSDHVYFPNFIDYFYQVDQSARDDLQRQLRATNYSSADIDVLHKLYLTLYEERLDGKNRFHLHNNTVVERAERIRSKVRLRLQEKFLGRGEQVDVDAVILATGFKDIGIGEGKERHPPLLNDVEQRLERETNGAIVVQRDYRVPMDGDGLLYLNGLCESSHGLGDAGSFSLLSIRAADIIDSLEDSLERRSLLRAAPAAA
jgi:L-ornithine N5-oxygenase